MQYVLCMQAWPKVWMMWCWWCQVTGIANSLCLLGNKTANSGVGLRLSLGMSLKACWFKVHIFNYVFLTTLLPWTIRYVYIYIYIIYIYNSSNSYDSYSYNQDFYPKGTRYFQAHHKLEQPCPAFQGSLVSYRKGWGYFRRQGKHLDLTSWMSKWMFPKIGEHPQNGWFVMENLIKHGMIWGGTVPLFFWKHPNENALTKANVNLSWSYNTSTKINAYCETSYDAFPYSILARNVSLSFSLCQCIYTYIIYCIYE